MPETTSKPSPTALLRDLRVAAPCQESWKKMPGGNRVRSCARCQHKVYNLSEMSAADAAELLHRAEGRICVRFYQRADGTVMTKDCPVGVQTVRRRLVRTASIAVTAMAVACGFSLVGKDRSEQSPFVRWVSNLVAPEPEAEIDEPRPMVQLPMVNPGVSPTPTPVRYPAVMGTPAPPPPRNSSFAEPEVIMGDAIIAPSSLTSEKPYLKGHEAEIEGTPRPDPFVKHRLPGLTSPPHPPLPQGEGEH